MGQEKITLGMLGQVLEGRFELALMRRLPDGRASWVAVQGDASIWDNEFLRVCETLGLEPDAPVMLLTGNHGGSVTIHVGGNEAAGEKAHQLIRDGKLRGETWQYCREGGSGDAAGPV